LIWISKFMDEHGGGITGTSILPISI
jgi:hypothetical protein